MPRTLKFCDYCANLVIKGDEFYHEFYCMNDVLKSPHYKKYLLMNRAILIDLRNYLKQHGNLSILRELFLAYVSSPLKDYGFDQSLGTPKDLLPYLNSTEYISQTPEPPKNAQQILHHAMLEICMFNTLIDNLLCDDPAFKKTKKSKVTKETSEFWLLHLKSNYFFSFLQNKCKYCFALTNRMFDHLFGLGCTNFIRCLSNVPEKDLEAFFWPS